MPIIGFDESIYRITGMPFSDEEIAFDVYQNYLENWVGFIKSKYKTYDDFIISISQLANKLQKSTNIDIEYIKRFLYLGWNTEDLVRLNDKNIIYNDMLKVNNQWKPIQVYYSIYSLSEAACYSLTRMKAESHSKCLSSISNYFKTTKIEPWNLGFTGYMGNKKIISTIEPINFSKGIATPNSLTRVNTSPEEMIATCLKAEHKNRIKQHQKTGKKDLKYLYNPGLTTIFHFLYRLRIKSNYKEVEIFLSDAPENEVKAFSKNLTKINLYTNTLLEILILKKIGKKVLFEIMDEFVDKFNKKSVIRLRKQKYSLIS